jgi:putative SOS response-associated peptidase YedK
MCNRFRVTRFEELEEHFQAWDQIDHQPRFNVAPTQPVLTVRAESGKRKMNPMRWGLIPSWASTMTASNFNARAEKVMTTPAFSDAFASGRRCLIPADGFYEWQTLGSVKQPYCFEVGTGDLFAFAGLWDKWKDPSGHVIQSCAILTTAANTLVGEIHDRMPVILSPDKYDLWLNSLNVNDVLNVLNPYDAQRMRRYPVSTKLNDSKNDSAEYAVRITIESPEQARLF